MNTEIEVKFPHADHDTIRHELKSLGATCEQPMRLMRRAVYHNKTMSEKNAFLRIRDEGHRTTITYKQFDHNGIDGAQEYEATVSDFDSAVAIIDATGLVHDTYQESKRETWMLNDVEIVLDEWPWIHPYIEIEGSSEEAIKSVAAKLGLDWNDALFGGVANIYALQNPHIGEAGIDEINYNWPIIKFNMQPPNLLLSAHPKSP